MDSSGAINILDTNYRLPHVRDPGGPMNLRVTVLSILAVAGATSVGSADFTFTPPPSGTESVSVPVTLAPMPTTNLLTDYDFFLDVSTPSGVVLTGATSTVNLGDFNFEFNPGGGDSLTSELAIRSPLSIR